MSNTHSDTAHSNTNEATVESNIRPEYDDEIQKIADYVLNYCIDNESPNPAEAWCTARHCLMDTNWHCAFLSVPSTWGLIALIK